MIRNYFKTAFRNLWNNKFYSLLNIGGLAVGLATSIMLLLWVQHERSYDEFHQDGDRLYRVNAHFNTGKGENVWSSSPGPLAVYSRTIPETEQFVRINYAGDEPLSDKDKNRVLRGKLVVMADEAFFSVFNFPLLYGSSESALKDPNHIILTESTAKSLFGSEKDLQQLIGETVVMGDDLFEVSAIAKDVPENSTIKFEAVVPMAYYAVLFTSWGGNGEWKTIDTDLGNYSFSSYVKVAPGAKAETVASKLTQSFRKDVGEDSNIDFRLQPVKDIHLISADGNTAALRQTQIIMMVVIMLLAIASINYINLSTSRSLQRAQEVSVRKIIGASKWNLFLQFTSETVMLFAFAVVLAAGLIHLFMPLYNSITGKELIFSLQNLSSLKPAALAIVGCLIASSVYPALLLSSFKPIESLKGRLTTGLGTATFRKALVVSQFAIAMILIVSTLVMSNQLKFIQTKSLGYDKSHVFVTPVNGNARTQLEAIKTELSGNPAIAQLAVAGVNNMSNIQSNTGDLEWAGKPQSSSFIITQVFAEKEFIPTMGLNLVEGQNFTGTPADTSSFILNQTAVNQMGLQPPYVGQEITFHSRKGKIRGIVEDFNFRNLKEKISPLILFSFWDQRNFLYVRTQPNQAAQAIAAVEQQLTPYLSDAPFSYRFLDDQFQQQYQSDRNSSTLFRIFAGVAIFLSCLGLLGLASYTAQTRKKEIGIRKALGASVNNIIALINRDLIALVLIAIVAAVPVAWYFMDNWLQDFAYRIEISWWIFVLAGIFTLLIALLSVSFQAIKAAVANPVKSLRTEN